MREGAPILVAPDEVVVLANFIPSTWMEYALADLNDGQLLALIETIDTDIHRRTSLLFVGSNARLPSLPVEFFQELAHPHRVAIQFAEIAATCCDCLCRILNRH